MYRTLSPHALGFRVDLPSAIELAAQTGWEGVEIGLAEAAELAAQRSADDVAHMLEASGLRAGGAGLPLDWRNEYEQGALDVLSTQAAVAQRLGCTRIHTWIMPASNDLPFRENFAHHVARLQPIAAVLNEHGCRLGLEFIGPRHIRTERRYGFVSSMDAMLGLAEAIGPNVGLLVDCYHWYTGLGTLADLRSLRRDDVVYVHVNDAPVGIAPEDQHDQVRRLPGATGVIDLAGFLAVLRELGYDGPVTPEPFDKSLAALGAEEACKQACEHMRAAGV